MPHSLSLFTRLFDSLSDGKFMTMVMRCLKMRIGNSSDPVACTSQESVGSPGHPEHSSSLNHTRYPCSTCDDSVSWEQRGVECETCCQSFHVGCKSIRSGTYEQLGDSVVCWNCLIFDRENDGVVSWNCVICDRENDGIVS